MSIMTPITVRIATKALAPSSHPELSLNPAVRSPTLLLSLLSSPPPQRLPVPATTTVPSPLRQRFPPRLPWARALVPYQDFLAPHPPALPPTLLTCPNLAPSSKILSSSPPLVPSLAPSSASFLSAIFPHSHRISSVDLGDRMHPTHSVTAPPPLRRSDNLVDYPPIHDLRMQSLDCLRGAVVASMRAHPRQAPDTPVVRTRFSTPRPFPILPLLSDSTVNPGIHHRREGIIPPTALHLPGTTSKRRRPIDPLAPLPPEYPVTPTIYLPFRHQQTRLTHP